jgi:hypothetical protein
VKFIFLLLFVLGGLATAAKSDAVLPAYLLGLVAAGTFHRDPQLMARFRATAFSLPTCDPKEDGVVKRGSAGVRRSRAARP